ncbi:hypothetical protein DICVIV_09779 [Dictyocaulus viviparus]|uniref:Uncharacterized protein n=1 Tax=Dictyocaulus viviparus TaxID=29172 RepID=A0A0D8XKC8_DICVI|nr:hypothetical protein DICVIV_09779 [Dictyocaulus viviparus]
MQISNGSDDEEMGRMRLVDSEYDPHRGHHREYNRDPVERELPMKPMVPPDSHVREGIVFEYVNYYEFLRCWLDESNNIIFKTSKSPIRKRVHESITPTTHAEKLRIILPEGVFDRNELLHCDMTITGLPPSVFFGSGFGHKSNFARNAAAKDLIDKCCRIGLITEVLHTSIGNHPVFKKRDLPRSDYSLAVDALVDLDRKLCCVCFLKWTMTFFDCEATAMQPFNRIAFVIYEKMEFCRRCNLYGHSERYCRNDHSDNRDRSCARSPTPPSRILRGNYVEERDYHCERFDRANNIDRNIPRYPSDEIARKQREDLFRREMMLRQSGPGENWVDKRMTPQPLFSSIDPLMKQPLMSLNESRMDMLGTIHPRANSTAPGVDPVLLEQQLRAARDESMRSKLEAKARKLEEDERLKQKEQELEWRMQKELEIKKQALEVEIRRKVQLEERAKLQMELSRTYHQTMQPAGHQYPDFQTQNCIAPSYPFSSFSAFGSMTTSAANGVEGNSYSSAPDFEMEEIKRLVKETEDKLLELQRNCREAELSAIFQSRAFQMVAELGDNAHMLDRSQKQNLLRELKELLSRAGSKENEKRVNERRRSRSRSRGTRLGSNRIDRDRNSVVRSRSRSRSRNRELYKRWKQGDDYKEVRVQVGGVTLRNLSPTEQRTLKVGEIVVAQDMKTGKWTTARVVKVVGKRATLGIGNTTWKKDLSELYKEIPDWLL